MITETKPLSLVEANELVGTGEEKQEIKSYIKRFNKIKLDKAKELRKEIEALDNMKIKTEHIVKVIDIIPEDIEDVNKIFSDAGLDENETNKILEIIKKYR